MSDIIHNSYSKALDLLGNFNAAATSSISHLATIQDEAHLASLASIADTVSESYKKISNVPKLFPDISELKISSPFLEVGREANLNIVDLLKSDIENPLSSIAGGVKSWVEPFQDSISEIFSQAKKTGFKISDYGTTIKELSEINIQTHIAKVSEISVLAESSFAALTSENIGAQLSLDPAYQSKLGGCLLDITKEYSGLCSMFKAKPETFLDLGPYLAASTPVEYFNAADLYETISLEERTDNYRDSKRVEIEDDNAVGLERFLPEINPELVMLWKGATQVLKSDNPDKARHFSISIRELLTQVLHNLAPDKQVGAWTVNPQHFHNNRPTRKARLLYICRDINTKPLSSFVQTDIESVLKFINLFQQGTHSVSNPFNSRQLIALKARAESTIKYLIEISTK